MRLILFCALLVLSISVSANPIYLDTPEHQSISFVPAIFVLLEGILLSLWLQRTDKLPGKRAFLFGLLLNGCTFLLFLPFLGVSDPEEAIGRPIFAEPAIVITEAIAIYLFSRRCHLRLGTRQRTFLRALGLSLTLNLISFAPSYFYVSQVVISTIQKHAEGSGVY